jgi:hypothetical protein
VKMKTLRKLRMIPARRARRFDFDITDATMEPDPGPPPEAVFDRSTGPFGSRRHGFVSPGMPDEET